MNKTTKGAVAAAAAGVLLLGGVGSLAYWNATGTVAGGTISSGQLTLTNADCDPATAVDATGSVWMLDGSPATVFDPDTQKIVPGDTLTKVCTYDITASGAHLTANLEVSTPDYTNTPANALTDGTAGSLTVDPTFKILSGTVDQRTITSADNAKKLEATVVVTFPGATSSNLTQGLSAMLDNIIVTATQTHS